MVHPASTAPSPEVLAALRDVIEGPLLGIAERFSRFLAPVWPHTALVIFTSECTGRPRKVSGDPEIVGRVSIAELEVVRDGLERGVAFDGGALIAGRQRRVWAVRDAIDTLLMLVPKQGVPKQGEIQSDSQLVQAAFGIVAVAIRHQVQQASPDYLAQSRAASSERARTIVELTDTYVATLESVLATLRSKDLDDRRARLVAIETASAAVAGRLELESVSGWGSRVSVAFPLDPVAPPTDVQLLADLNPREVEVLHHLAAGRRNRAIAEVLGISESTVKFHVAAVLKKLGVASRGEAGAIARDAGIRA